MGKRSKMEKILVVCLILGLMLSMTGLVIAENVCSGDESAVEPPFEEGPQAERCNRMSDEAPCGPWAWEGGD